MRSSFFICMCILLLGCVTPNDTTTANSNVKRYAVGKGGGFTGDYTEYILNEDGKVYKYDFKYDREVFYKELDKVDLNYFLEKIDDLALDGIDINEPGNMNYYIDVRIGKNSINKILWGANLYYAPKEIIDFHKELYNKLKEFE